MSRQLLNSTWFVAAHKNEPKTDSPLKTREQARLMPWLAGSPAMFYESYEECAGNIDPATEQVVEVTVSVVGTRRKVTID